MKCNNVEYTHKALEFGRDIIFYQDDEVFGRRIYTAVQVKKIKITTPEMRNILQDIDAALGEPFTDKKDHKKKDIDRFILLTSNEVAEDAKQHFSAALRGSGKDRYVTSVDGGQLVDHLDKYFPAAFWEEYDYFTKYFNTMKKDFETIKDISAIGQKEPVPLENIYVSLRVSEEIKKNPIHRKRT